MKKFLALVLALVMTMSLVVVNAGAEDFTDNSAITYEEAVDVMTAIGVVSGYPDGSFNPTGTLTRGAAAKIICNMILGPTEAGALATVEAPFSDVPADHVFAGYIAYCASEGIVGGYTDGTFKPAGTLTGYAFMKMLLGALGYDADAEGYTGANFAINVAKRALNVGLNDGLEGAFVGSKALTREEACLYAFNTLQADMVEYWNNQSITIGDVVISNNSTATVVANNAATETIANDDDMQFAEKYFGKLTITNKVADDYGRPAITWKYDKDIVGTYVTEEPVAVYVEGFDAAELKALNDEYYFDVPKVMLNGYEWLGVNVATLASREYTGLVIELYTNDDGDTIDHVVAIQDYFAQVTDEDEDSIELTIYNPWATPITTVETFTDNTKKDNDTFDQLSAAYDEDDYLRVYYEAAALNYELIDFADVDSVTVTVDTIKVDAAMNGYVTADGVKYTFASAYMNNTALTVGDEYTLFLDANGYVIGSELVKAELAAIDDVYYVDNVWVTTATVAGNTGVETYKAQLVAMDGTVSEIVLENVSAYDSATYEGELVTISDKKWVSGSTTYKGGNDKFDLTVWTEFGTDDYDWDKFEAGAFSADLKKTSTRISDGTNTYRLNDNTQYLFIEDTQDALTTKVVTGGVAYDADGSDVNGVIVITEHKTKVASYVIILTDDADQAQTYSDDAVFMAAQSTELGDGYRVQKVYKADGSVDYMNVAETEYPASGTLAAGFYTYDTNEDGYYVLSAATDLVVPSPAIWDEQEGAVEGVTLAKNALFEGLLTVSTIEDIEVSEAAFVDAHDTTATDAYDKTVSSLAALCDLKDNDKVGTVTLNLNVAKDGAVVIVVTGINVYGK